MPQVCRRHPQMQPTPGPLHRKKILLFFFPHFTMLNNLHHPLPLLFLLNVPYSYPPPPSEPSNSDLNTVLVRETAKQGDSNGANHPHPCVSFLHDTCHPRCPLLADATLAAHRQTYPNNFVTTVPNPVFTTPTSHPRPPTAGNDNWEPRQKVNLYKDTAPTIPSNTPTCINICSPESVVLLTAAWNMNSQNLR